MFCLFCQRPVGPGEHVCASCGRVNHSCAAGGGNGASNRQELTGYYENSWAVVIGVNTYQHVDNLDFAIADAHAVKQALEFSGFDPQRIFMLLDEQASRQNIQDLLSVEIARKTSLNDRLLVFWAGHGHDFTTPSGRRMGYLMPYDGDPDYLASRCISMDEINLWSEYIPAKHILYVMDCCYSGLAASRSTGIDSGSSDYIEKVMRRSVRQIITAGRDDQKVFEDSGHGIFTRNFVRAIRGDADIRGRGFITGFDLGHYLESRVYEESRGLQQPLFRYLKGDGEFVFGTKTGVTRLGAPEHEQGSGLSVRSSGVSAGLSLRGKVILDAQQLIGILYRTGDIQDWFCANALQGISRWKQAAMFFCPEALWLLGNCYLTGTGIGKDQAKAVLLLKKSAAQGFAPAMYSLGLCCECGKLGPNGKSQARKWFQRAADADFGPALFALGLLEKGQKQTDLFRKAARLGCVCAAYNMGVIYAGSTQNSSSARLAYRCFNKAARQGYVHAQFNLAMCYLNGFGVEKNAVLALAWLKRCILNGDAGAREVVERIKVGSGGIRA